MKVDKTAGLKIKVKGTDADNLKSAIQKIVDETGKAGYVKMPFNDAEISTFKALNDKLK